MRRVTGYGDIDRNKPVSFRFNGELMSGFAGDTLASALLANDVRLVGRSFKYHRRRGIYADGAQEPNALVSLGQGLSRIPNVQATIVPLRDGLSAQSQNHWPSLHFDVQALNGVAARFLGAGFYYKTFMGPVQAAWMTYEWLIRRAAGLGAPPEGPAPSRARTRCRKCDTLVVGAGLAGLAAACDAAKIGSVILAEQDSVLGGQALASPQEAKERKALAALRDEVLANDAITVLRETQVFGVFDHGQFGAVEVGRQECLHLIEAKQSVIATGSYERLIAFPGNDLPGVMLAGSIRTYLNRFGVLCGENVVLFANQDSASVTALDLARAGARVTLVHAHEAEIADRGALRDAGVTLISGLHVISVQGRRRVRGVVLSDGRKLRADLLGVSGGWSPTLHLTSHLGHKPVWSQEHAAFLPDMLPSEMRVVGAAAGDFRAIPDGNAKPYPVEQAGLTPVWHTGAMRNAFVDLQNDVTVKDVAQAYDEGFQSVEHLKRYTTLGMGTDQGRLSNVPGLALMASFSGQSIPETGTTTFRPPFSPVSLGALAGAAVGPDFHMRRRSPLHSENLIDGAEMIHSGLWDRPWYYHPNGADVDTAYIREMEHVRQTAAICDVSSLGKIDIEGPDAAAFLDRLYANPFAKLPVGRARWGIMLRDDGYVFDDGTTSRLTEHHYFMTTTTAKAGQVLARMEFLLETDWRDLRVHVASVTDQWAAIALAGPHARDILSDVCGHEVADEELPFLGVATHLRVAGVAVRVLRVSFSGEMSFEIYVPAFDGPAVWRALRNAGAQTEGLEALGALRIEKGHIAGGEFDGTTTMDDLGLSSMFSKKKPFIGRVLAGRPGLSEPERLQLVGLQAPIGSTLNTGAVLSFGAFEGVGDGRVTSATFSPTMGRYIGLALLKNGRRHYGDTIQVRNPAKGISCEALVVAPHFLDPEGERMRG